MKTNKIMAVAMAVIFGGFGYVGGRAMTPTSIEPANITVAAEVEEKVVTEKVEVEKTVEVEKEEETKFEGLVKVLNNNGTLKCFVILTSKGAVEKPYMEQAIWYINTYCNEQFRYDNAPGGRFQVMNERTGRAVKYDTYKVMD